MLIKDINKLEITINAIGATCPYCGGDLSRIQSKGVLHFVLGMLINHSIHTYQCHNCKHHVKLF